MNQYRFPDNRIWKGAFGVFMIALLFLARDSMFTTAVIGFNKAQFLMLGLICAAGIVFLAVNRRNLKAILTDRRMLVIAVFSALMLLPMVVKRDWQLMYFSVLLCLLVAVFLTYFVTYREAARYYVGILTVLGAYSVLAAYILRIPVDGGTLSVPVFYNSIGIKFYNFFLSIVPDTYVKNRNFGIFREPGVYQYFILLALFLNNYAVQWRKGWQLWLVNGILAVTMLSTFATGGVIEMGLLAVVMFFDKKWYRDRRIRWAAILLVGGVAAAAMYCIARKNALYWEVYDMLIGKFLSDNESGPDRINSIFNNLQIFVKNPLFGERVYGVLHSMVNNTSSTLILYAMYGVVGGCLNVAAWVALVWEKERSLWANLALLLILFMSFNTQNLITDVFFWLFPVMALVERSVLMAEGLLLKSKEKT